MIRHPWLLVAISAALACGCQSARNSNTRSRRPTIEGRPDSTRLALADQWAQTLLDIGWVPVIPQREDVRVGDIYAFPEEPMHLSSTTPQGIRTAAATRWSTLDVNAALEQEYRQRPSWLETADAEMRVQEASYGPANGSAAKSIYAGDSVPVRHSIVNLRGASSTVFDVEELEPFLPPEIAPLIVGPISADNLAVSVRVGDAESYSLSQDRFLDMMFSSSGSGGGPNTVAVDPERLSLFATPGSDTVYLSAITEVIYIRSLDLVLRSKVPLPGWQEGDDSDHPFLRRAQIVSAEETDAREIADAAKAAEVEESEAAVAPDKIPSPFRDAYARAGEMNELLASLDLDSPISGILRFVSVSDHSVTLRRTFPRGLAVAVRGFTLEVDAQTGTARRICPLGTGFLPPVPDEEEPDSMSEF